MLVQRMSNSASHWQPIAHSTGITLLTIDNLCSIHCMAAQHCSLKHNRMDWAGPVANDCGFVCVSAGEAVRPHWWPMRMCPSFLVVWHAVGFQRALLSVASVV